MVSKLEFGGTVVWSGGLFEMISTVESVSTDIPAGTPTCGVVGRDGMTFCSGAMTDEICHMTVSVIALLYGQR
jgi:hypothetical protein